MSSLLSTSSSTRSSQPYRLWRGRGTEGAAGLKRPLILSSCLISCLVSPFNSRARARKSHENGRESRAGQRIGYGVCGRGGGMGKGGVCNRSLLRLTLQMSLAYHRTRR